jgi:hypothetical protein
VTWFESLDLLATVNALRDVMVILAALALLLMSAFASYAVWQLYRLGREVHAELQPILQSVQGTSESLRGVTSFVSQQLVSPASSAISLGFTARGLIRSASRVYAQLRQGDKRPGGV